MQRNQVWLKMKVGQLKEILSLICLSNFKVFHVFLVNSFFKEDLYFRSSKVFNPTSFLGTHKFYVFLRRFCSIFIIPHY